MCELESRDILERLMSSSFGVYENRIHFYQFLKMDYSIYFFLLLKKLKSVLLDSWF